MEILTQNMSINNGDPERRWRDLSELVVTATPDLMLFQEVSTDVGLPALEALRNRLGPDYSVRSAMIYPGQENQQVAAVLTRLGIAKSYCTDYEGVGNQTQIVELKTGSTPLVAANVHQKSSPLEGDRRKKSVISLTDLFWERYGSFNKLAAGDWNSARAYPTILRMKRLGYQSAFKSAHGTEPRFTYPTLPVSKLLEGKYLTQQEVDIMKMLARITSMISGKDIEIARFTTDYIFTKGLGPAIGARLVVGKDRVSKPISDHKGILATFA